MKKIILILMILGYFITAFAGEREDFIKACEDNNVESIQTIIDSGFNLNTVSDYVDDSGNTLLLFAVKNTNTNLTRLLINAGADVNHIFYMDLEEIPMYNQYAYGLDEEKMDYSLLLLAAIKGQTDIAKMLIDAGGNVNFTGGLFDLTPLIMASNYGHKKICEYLIDAGADLDTQNINGFTALIIASMGERTNIVQLLIKAGADINIRDLLGYSARDYAMMFGYAEIAELLKAAGAE